MADIVKQYAFYFDQTRCMGCQTCVVACKDWNNVKPGNAKWRNLYDTEEGVFPNVEVFMTVYSCNHCENPACVAACPYQAIYKRKADGIVVVDRAKCQGAASCKTACPYDAPQFADDYQEKPTLPLTTPSKGHTMQKCDMCWGRVAAGLRPACVASCLTRALDFGTIDELTAKYPDAETLKSGGVLKGFPSDTIGSGGAALSTPTNPSFLFKPKG
ncbi:MAG: 4Fe-4S dicluster domain-containing protein [Deferribacterales bacterium]|nr:4Fe-4S dicluster domain-containing protein [Deferribacterales bacterium]